MISGYSCPHCGRATMSPANPGAVRAQVPCTPIDWPKVGLSGFKPKHAWNSPILDARMDCHMQCWWCDGEAEATGLLVSVVLDLLDGVEALRAEVEEEKAVAAAKAELNGRAPPVCCPTCGHRRGPLGWNPCTLHQPWDVATTAGGYDTQSLTAQLLIHGPDALRHWMWTCWVHGLAHGAELSDGLKEGRAAAMMLEGAVAHGWIERVGYMPTSRTYGATEELAECWFYRPNRKCMAAHAFVFGPPEWP